MNVWQNEGFECENEYKKNHMWKIKLHADKNVVQKVNVMWHFWKINEMVFY